MDAELVCELIAQRLWSQPGASLLKTRLYLVLRQAILDGGIPTGIKLPPSRMLADALSLGRNTVVRAYDQLLVEGYLETRVGDGTYVVESLAVPGRRAGGMAPRPAVAPELLSLRGRRIASMGTSSSVQHGAFMPGIPDTEHFPFATWRRLLSKYVRREQSHLLHYGVGGFGPLRAELADYLRATRLIHCEPRQVMIFNGTHQAIDLCARLLCDAGDRVWMEEPGYWGARTVLQAAGLQAEPIALDDKGIAPTAADWAKPPRLVFMSPSSQYPTGIVLSLERRLELLARAREHDAWLIEDDYDNELRYHNRPVASLFGLDGAERVIYLGTFSKVMYPGLRLAYLVVPPALVDAFAAGNAEMYREGRLTDQAALAEFIAEGHFAAHLKRMRAIYRERRDALRDILDRRLGDVLSASGGDAGLHLLYYFNAPAEDTVLADASMARGVVFRPLSIYYLDPDRARSGMNLGYACVPMSRIGPAADILCQVLEQGFAGIGRRPPAGC